MKRLLLLLSFVICNLSYSFAQGWPSEYKGVMLQAFSWDSYDETNWVVLQQQADELASTFELVWLPQSGNCGGQSMGYDDLYWFTNYNSSFGSEAELRSLINTFKAKGIKTIADVVINHRKNKSNWVDFPAETYNGVKYEMLSTDICKDDDGGQAAKEATKLGLSVSTNNDTGEDWGGMRDLDHKSQNVQTIVKAYLNFLLNDLGYAGFRYDMVKGYSPEFTGIYNTASNPEFSVGECWDGTSVIKSWIDGTKVNNAIQSAAFDFQFKYVVRNAVDKKDWTYLGKQNDGNYPLVNQMAYRRYAVTFVENHDTQLRSDGSSNGPLKKDTLAANAYLLAMPGTPCIFQPHWLAYPTEIKAMVAARKTAGINAESNYGMFRSNTKYYASIIKKDNTNANLLMLVAVGDVAALEATDAINEQQWVKVLSGYHYAYYFPKAMETAYVDLASSVYEGEQKALLTAVTASEGAQLVYTTNGSDPTASSTKVASGTTITIPIGTTTLKVGLLINNQVSGIITRNYTVKEKKSTEVVIPDFCHYAEGDVCAFFEAPVTWTQTIKCWAWNNSPAENFTSATGTWPGADCTYLGDALNGNKVWKWKWDGTRQKNTTVAQPGMIIFSNGSNGSPKTADLQFKNGGYYTKEGFFGLVTAGINDVTLDKNANDIIYDLQGRKVVNGQLPRGIYIKNGKKFIVR